MTTNVNPRGGGRVGRVAPADEVARGRRCEASAVGPGGEGHLKTRGPGAAGTAPGFAVRYFLNVKKVREAVSVMLTLPLVVSVRVVE